jgi:nitrile hydratase
MTSDPHGGHDHDHAHDHAHDQDHDEDHPPHDTDAARVALTARVAAIETALLRAGAFPPEQVDDVIDTFTERLGPRHGSRLVALAWTDPDFRAQLLDDATSIIRERGYDLEGGDHRELPFLELRVVENAPGLHNVIVCTLCSCYPLALLGPQPRWYKSAEYRARMVVEPRKVLGEFGLKLPEGTTVRVWDSTAETRYLVLPERPAGTEGWDVERLARLVNRDSMIGVALATPADALSDAAARA